MISTKKILSKFEQRESLRTNFEAVWEEIFNHFLPRRSSMYHQSQGVTRTGYIYDSTPGVSLLRLAAVLNSMLTNRQLEWFELETDDEDLNELPATKEWLEHDQKQLRHSLDNSNFYSQAHEGYIDLAGLGMFTMYIEEARDPDRDFYFSTRHIREVYTSEGDQGAVDSIDLVREMTARQIMERWRHARLTGTIPDEVRRDYEKEPEKTHEIIQSVFPNEDYDPSPSKQLDPLKLPYQCAWIHRDKKQDITRGGYHEFPFVLCNWAKRTGEDYGVGPGWDALPDTKILYAMRKSLIRVANKIADPPLQMPAKGYLGKIDLAPGGLNFYDAVVGERRIETIEIGRNFPIGLDMLQDQRDQIREWFYTSQLQLIDVREMTAEEARLRTAENARILGPTFGRLTDEFLDRLVGRCLGILRRAGKLAEIPQEVIEAARKKGTSIRVKFKSPLAKAQMIEQVTGIQRTVATALEWAEKAQNPAILDGVNFDEALKKIHDADGGPLEILNDDDTVKQIRQARAAEMRVRAQIENAQGAGKAAKDIAGAGREFKEIAGGR